MGACGLRKRKVITGLAVQKSVQEALRYRDVIITDNQIIIFRKINAR